MTDNKYIIFFLISHTGKNSAHRVLSTCKRYVSGVRLWN